MEAEGAEATFPGHGGDPVPAFLARPAGPGPWPALVVVHEVFGPTDWIRSACRRLAGEGFLSLAPDLWARDRGRGFPEGTEDLKALKEFVGTVPAARITGDLAGAARFLAARPDVRRGAVGTVGFCMGGIFAFHLACEEGTPVRACVDFYGRIRYDASTPEHPRSPLERVRELKCPLLAVFGAMDHLVPLKDVLALKESLGGRGSVIAYPRAGHGFLNETRAAYREEEAKDAWHRAVLFLRERLAPDTIPPGLGPAVPEYRPPPSKKGRRRRGRR
jgi:carboxymethylenebutenolidase